MVYGIPASWLTIPVLAVVVFWSFRGRRTWRVWCAFTLLLTGTFLAGIAPVGWFGFALEVAAAIYLTLTSRRKPK
jgi:hypothetical protein